jgi:hypothetical protein
MMHSKWFRSEREYVEGTDNDLSSCNRVIDLSAARGIG